MKAIPPSPALPTRRRPAGAAAVALVLLATAAATAGCAPTVTTHGHRLDAARVAQIRPGVTSREEVAQLLGSPSSTGALDGQSWYYVTQKTERRSFYQEKVAAQDVVRIDFDPNGIVQAVNQRDLETARAIDPAEEKTRTMGNELTLVQQFLGNIGRFNTGTPEGGLSQQGSAARR